MFKGGFRPSGLLLIFLLTVTGNISGQTILRGTAPAITENSVRAGNGTVSAAVPAQTPEPVKDGWKPTRGSKSLEVELGFAPMQPTFFAEKEYDTEGRKFAALSLRFGKTIGTVKGVTYQYLFEVMPVSFTIKNEVKNPAYVSDAATPGIAKTRRENTYGFGIQPAGFRFIFLAKKRLKPYAQAGAGFLFSGKPIPIPESTTYNFIGDFGGGLMYNVNKKSAVRLGYRYFHISNMNIGEFNPGYNANIFYLGYSWSNK